jgi:hypothetical protein
MQHYTYIHRKADTGDVFYVGKGKRCDRMKLRSGRSERWTRTADKHGFVPEVVARWATAEEAFEHEKFLIWCFRDMGIDLCNHTEGGEGAPGYTQSEQTKAKRNAKLRGRVNSDKTIQRMRIAQAGKVISQEARHKIAATLTGRYVGANNPNAKPVACVETGQVFGSMQEAAAWLQGLGNAKASFKSIHAAVSGAKKTAYGYQWRRA